MSPEKMLVARPVPYIPTGLEFDNCGELQITMICEKAKAALDWKDPGNPILFRVFSPYRGGLKEPDDDNTDPQNYMFPERVNRYGDTFKIFFEEFDDHKNKILDISGYYPFRGRSERKNGTRIIVADATTVAEKQIISAHSRYKLFEEKQDELKTGISPGLNICSSEREV